MSRKRIISSLTLLHLFVSSSLFASISIAAPDAQQSVLTIERFSPEQGRPGSLLRIQGSGFMRGDRVTMGDTNLTVRTITPPLIVCEIPADAQSGPLLLWRDKTRYPIRGNFELLRAPIVDDFTPKRSTPGGLIAIEGKNFSLDTKIVVTGIELPIVRRELPGKIWIKLPPDATSGPLVVVNRGGSTQSATSLGIVQQARINAFYPSSGPPGTLVRLQGSPFDESVRFFLGEKSLTASHLSPTQAEIAIPENSTSAPFFVESFGARFKTEQTFIVTPPTPELTFELYPQRVHPGGEVTLLLARPQRDIVIYFNDRSLPHQRLSNGKRIVVAIPSDAHDGWIEVVWSGKRFRSKQPLRIY